jgi:tetratricopeptide (TPR) repeat protein
VDKLTPNDPDTLALFAEILLARGQEERAVRLLDLAVTSKGDSARVRTARAKYFNSRGKVSEALQEFELAVAAAPEDVDLALARARALAAARRYMDAATAMDEILLARPTDINVQVAAAEVKLAAGDPDGAQQMADTILARQAKHLRALFVRARAIETSAPAEPVRAIGAYRQVLAVEPGHAESLARLWPLYLKDRAKTDAIATLEHLRLLGEADRAAELELAALYNETGINPAAGLKIVEAALKHEPDNARLVKLRKELAAKAPRAPSSAGGPVRGPPVEGGGRGIEIMRGGRTN